MRPTLDENDLGDDGFTALADAVCARHRLAALWLNVLSNDLSGVALWALRPLVATAPQLQSLRLDVSHNRIGLA